MKFFDGLPDQDTVQKVFDNLDRMRGVDVFLNTLAPASLLANIEGLKSVGCDNCAAVIHEDRVDAKTLLLTPNTQTANWVQTMPGKSWSVLLRLYAPLEP